MSTIDIWRVIALGSFFALLWTEVIGQLKTEWSLNPQYGYGWSVPFLSLYLILQRWSQRPLPVGPQARTWPIASLVFCALLVFPIRFLAEANPDWRLLSWALALSAVVASISYLYLVGGWAWLRHFGFPIVFFLVAVPWPSHFEQVVIQNLMRTVATINVSLLNIAGVPALQHGNVIEVGSGLIGIEEACSGVRSFQATLMLSLFLGEFYLFKIAPRILLVIAGALLAFFFNLVRTALLVWLGAYRGPNAIETWHDPAGLTILLACLFGLWLLSLMMRRSSPPAAEALSIDNKFVPLRLFRPLLLALTLWIVLAEIGVQLYYRFHQSSMASPRWTVLWPTSEIGYKSVPIPPETKNLLRYNDGSAATWKAADGHLRMMYFFRWLPGRSGGLSVKIHRPDICLPATGLTMRHDDGSRLLNVNGVDLHIHSYRFEDRAAQLHVFYCYWDASSSNKNVAAAEQEDWTARGRLRAVFKVRPEIGAVLELIVWGYQDDSDAERAMRRELEDRVRLG
jgi:exosortase